MATRFEVKIDVAQLERMGVSLSRVNAESIGQTAMTGLNATAAQAYEDARVKMIRGINLTDDYLRTRMEYREATNAVNPVAVIKAFGDLTNLGAYRPRQMSKVVTFTNAMIAPLIGKFGTNPRKDGTLLPWKKRTGDPARGIAVDRKQAGLNVEVIKSSPKAVSYAFMITTAGGQRIAAARAKGDHKGKGKVHALLGPSVYQLFNHALDATFLEGVQTQLSNSVVSVTSEELRKALE